MGFRGFDFFFAPQDAWAELCLAQRPQATSELKNTIFEVLEGLGRFRDVAWGLLARFPRKGIRSRLGGWSFRGFQGVHKLTRDIIGFGNVLKGKVLSQCLKTGLRCDHHSSPGPPLAALPSQPTTILRSPTTSSMRAQEIERTSSNEISTTFRNQVLATTRKFFFWQCS